MKLKFGLEIGLAALMVGGVLVAEPLQKTQRVLVALENGGAVLLNAENGKVLQTFKTGPNAFGALFSPCGKRAFITDKETGNLVEVDPKTGAEISSLKVGINPQQPALHTDGTMFIPLSGEASVAVVDLKTRTVEKVSTGAGSKPHIVSLSPDQKTLWVTVQGMDAKVVAFSVEEGKLKLLKEFRYDIFPRVISAMNGTALFTGHHSTGLHLAKLGEDRPTTPYMDTNGNGSEAAKQIEGIATIPGKELAAITHEGRKALVLLSGNALKNACDISPLADKPYWVSLDSAGEVAFVSIPGKALVEAYDVKTCNKKALWSQDVGGKAKRMSLSELN